jgi:Fic family protein
MSEKLKIKLSIADRVYPLTVEPSQEEGLRSASKKIDAIECEMSAEFDASFSLAQQHSALQQAQQKLEITKWIEWFSSIIMIAQDDAEKTIQFTIKKVKFFDKYDKSFNDRQRKVINRILEEGDTGFKGGMNVNKYISITNTTKATATRDLQELVAMNVFVSKGAGRATGYEINI